MMLHKKMWTSSNMLSKRVNNFEEAVLKLLREKVKFDPLELMSKVARQILTTKAMVIYLLLLDKNDKRKYWTSQYYTSLYFRLEQTNRKRLLLAMNGKGRGRGRKKF